ncbi:PaaX family transcriptional regulator C-terminal domain-containing protein [Pelagicoccus sp. SDUM812005]|uniref:PaaX family transcriptional regulator C-terminal domain-containing protein n=1 Tax=Pelagicoccus sp. SDUM812005 TaxID=3041257 RepID=UPI00280F11F6|nr:PaaX family transcriptional regulator C-terminal domain-containing protein [Pelagicoccus sp. SDUM812005]MDQ8183388.1 PaaX family transcriptional regulator C-terminal domain-containing protein [Pelagicoccus sp. SDUM812005]
MQLSAKTKGLLELVVMTGIDTLAHSHCLQHVLTSYAGWDHPSSYLRQMRSLREKELLGYASNKTAWIPSLTASGIENIADRVAPERFWNIPWDGQWRTITFDIPAQESRERQRLNKWLKTNRFGHLQGSLWLSARPYEDWSQQIAAMDIEPSSVIFIEGKPLGLLSDESIVQHSWPWEDLHTRYQRYLNYVAENPPASQAGDPSASLANWFKKESTLWSSAIEIDPLLPRELHPKNYLGPSGWETRQQAFQAWRELLQS